MQPNRVDIDDARRVIQAELELAAAHLSLDLATFERLLHPDYVIIQPGGCVEGKVETLSSLRSGSRHWDLARSDQMEVRLYGNMAVVVGRWTGRGANAGVDFDYQARFLSLWIEEGGQWRNLTSQSTPMDS